MTETELAILGADGKPWQQEQRATTFKDPAEWLERWALGQESASGERVNEQIALGLSAWFAAIRNISEDVAKMDLILYSRRADDGKDRATGHPLYDLLHDTPNPEMGKLTFWQTILEHALGWADGYAEIQRDGAGRPIALWPLDPSTVVPRRTQGGELFYEIRTPDNIFQLMPEDIFHIHGMGAMGQGGYNMPRIAREALGTYLALQRFGGAFFAGGATVGAVLEHPNAMSDSALKHLRDSWSDRHGGAGNSGKVAILEEGMQYKQLGIAPEQSQFIETKAFAIEDVARWFRIPPHKLQHLARATWGNVEMLAIEYVGDTLLPWTKRIEQEIARKLIKRTEKFFAEHLIDSLLRADVKTRNASYLTAVQGGWMSRNEVRKRENLNPEEGLDTFLVPVNMAPAGMLGQFIKQQPVEDETGGEGGKEPTINSQRSDIFHLLADAHRPLLEDRFRSIIQHENGRVKRKGTGNGVFDDHQDWIRAALDTPIDAFCRSVWGAVRGSEVTNTAKQAISEATTAISVRHMGKVEVRMHNWTPWTLEEATEIARLEMMTLTKIMMELTND